MPQGDELDFGDMYGAGASGGGNLGSIVDYLFGALSNAGWFGMEGESGTEYAVQQDPGFWGNPESQYWDAGGYNVQNIQDLLGAQEYFKEDYDYEPGSGHYEEYIGGMGGFQKLLESLNLGKQSSEYGQDIGDIRGEMGAKMGALREQYPTMQKGSRYGGLGGASRKNLGGSRRDYMSDIYGLEQQQQEMTADLQEGFESDFYSDVGNWISGNIAPTYGG